jgi:hypothetical protein
MVIKATQEGYPPAAAEGGIRVPRLSAVKNLSTLRQAEMIREKAFCLSKAKRRFRSLP